MKLDQIKRGMKIVTEKETFVTTGVEIRGKHKLIHDIGWEYLAVNDDLTSASGDPEWDVQEIWDITVDGFVLIWKRPKPVREMTVEEISKELGYAIKVVGGEK